jgi:hypothetical protein
LPLDAILVRGGLKGKNKDTGQVVRAAIFNVINNLMWIKLPNEKAGYTIAYFTEKVTFV